MNTKTLVAVLIALSTLLLPLGSWTVFTVADSQSRINVLDERTGDLKQQMNRIEDKINRVLEGR